MRDSPGAAVQDSLGWQLVMWDLPSPPHGLSSSRTPILHVASPVRQSGLLYMVAGLREKQGGRESMPDRENL